MLQNKMSPAPTQACRLKKRREKFGNIAPRNQVAGKAGEEELFSLKSESCRRIGIIKGIILKTVTQEERRPGKPIAGR